MTDIGGAESATVETAPAVVETPARDYEAEARKMGNWTPKEEWKGDPANWKDAKTYVEHGENIIRLTKGELAAAEKRFTERIEKLERVNKTTLARVTADYEDRIATLTQQRSEAVDAGDKAAFEKADKAIEALKKDVPAKEEPKAEESIVEKGQAFVKANPWYLEEPDLARFLDHWTEKNGSLNPTLSFEENMRLGVEATMKKYPARFKGAAADRDAAVDGGSNFGGPSPRNEDQTELNKLPNEARAQCKADMAKYPKIYPTVKSWVKEYN